MVPDAYAMERNVRRTQTRAITALRLKEGDSQGEQDASSDDAMVLWYAGAIEAESQGKGAEIS